LSCRQLAADRRLAGGRDGPRAHAIGKKVGPEPWLYDLSLAPRSGAVTVLLRATQAGKTSLLRIMAGLDRPSTGTVRDDGRMSPACRCGSATRPWSTSSSYPSMRVADDIASPLRLRGERVIAARVRDIAARLHIEAFLDRYPSELSGGQHQRVALARALAKQAR
jgi:glycerol transport system ATP-binding protein